MSVASGERKKQRGVWGGVFVLPVDTLWERGNTLATAGRVCEQVEQTRGKEKKKPDPFRLLQGS